MESIAHKLEILIKENGITKVELASSIGLTSQTIANILNGADAKVSSIQKIAAFFKIPAGYLVDDNSPITQNVNGKSNVLVGRDNNGQISVSECQDRLEDAMLEIQHLKERLKDKEEMIEILKSQLNK